MTQIEIRLPLVSNLRTTSATIFRLAVVGWKYCGLTERSLLQGNLSLVPDIDNPVDPGAILVFEDGIKVGYIKATHLPPLHTLLSSFLSHLREQEHFHLSEMLCPLIVNHLQKGDDGRPYGEITVIGLNQLGSADTNAVVEGDHQIPLHKVWKANIVSDGNNLERVLTYNQPSSEALVRSYLRQHYGDTAEVISVHP